jgi:hypothetical protein
MKINYSRTAALPLWARMCIERLECDATLRNMAQLNYLMGAYARIHGVSIDERVRGQVVLICREKFGGLK